MKILEERRPAFMDLWDYRDPAGTEKRFEEALAGMNPETELSLYVQLLSQIARTKGLQKQFDEAHETLDRAEHLLANADLPVARLRCKLERGRSFDSPVHPLEKKQSAEAKACYLEVFEEGRAQGLDGLALDAVHMLGIIEPPDEALAWNEKAIRLAEESEDEHARAWLGSLYNNTGWSYHERGEFDAALALFQKALDWQKGKGKPQTIRIARWCVGRCLRSLGRVQEALKIQEALMAEYETSDDQEVGYTSEEMAECLHELGREEEAKTWFAQAHERLSENETWLQEHEPERLKRLERMAKP